MVLRVHTFLVVTGDGSQSTHFPDVVTGDGSQSTLVTFLTWW